ncbi:hypothetical protein SAMN04489867_2851 [Pedococcus dokdonensis]|uniref:Uncharacterized protein n=1 Tax=Pedococcus dokdonensis TaxID=443156 RepID=A0A1H0TL36_9MICO|nr:hypothetical protein [Pedococcus dokdonensis]SDP54226.1 hypothetical protein SAMN04489867_2851 [Pedococcus dokdonensis]
MTGEQWRVWGARVAVVVAGVVVAVALTKLWSFANADDPDVVEQGAIARTASSACATMREKVAASAVAATQPVGRRVGGINAQNDAVSELIATMQSLGSERLEADQPAAQWVEDWQRLVTARDAYARSLKSGKPKPMELPTIDGKTLVQRLNNVGVNCRVPLLLLAP